MALNARFAMNRSQTPLIISGGLPQKDWFVFFYNLYLAVTEGMPQEEQEQTVDASPATYTAVIRGQAHVGGGTVSAIEFSRNGTDWYDTGLTEGFVSMDARDMLRITYSSAPVLTYFPM